MKIVQQSNATSKAASPRYNHFAYNEVTKQWWSDVTNSWHCHPAPDCIFLNQKDASECVERAVLRGFISADEQAHISLQALQVNGEGNPVANRMGGVAEQLSRFAEHVTAVGRQYEQGLVTEWEMFNSITALVLRHNSIEGKAPAYHV